MVNNEQNAMHFQLLRQQLQSVLLQKENLKLQKGEYDEALKAIKEGDEIYRAVGMLIIKKDFKEISEDLKKQVKEFETNIKSLELRETQIQSRLKETTEKMKPAEEN
jgi:chaperonin cofactor prefoldin